MKGIFIRFLVLGELLMGSGIVVRALQGLIYLMMNVKSVKLERIPVPSEQLFKLSAYHANMANLMTNMEQVTAKSVQPILSVPSEPQPQK